MHTVSTLMMTGLIWFVQIVHYPLMASVGENTTADYSARHARRTTWVVAPLMLLEAATAVLLVLLPQVRVDRTLALAGLMLVLVIWISTAWLQVPCHRQLGTGSDPDAVARLVRTNWIRTAAWSARAAIAVVLCA